VARLDADAAAHGRTTTLRFQLTARTGHPDFLDLPWDLPLADWEHERLVEMPMGIHRHVVRTVEYEGRLYHLKELPRRYAEREWRFLRHLATEGVPVVDVVGVVTARISSVDDSRLEAVLITEHLVYSVPYRLLFLRQEHRELRDPMLDALVHLLVRLHLNGFYWGDCSLSNTLFRRDAGRLAAYVVDTETGELHEELSRGQRTTDVDLAIEKCAGELLDLQASGVLSSNADPFEIGEELRTRYQDLWDELTTDEVFAADERYRIYERLRRINELGYDVEELELLQDEPGVTRMKLRTSVLEPGRYRRILAQRTGLEVQDNQARRLLNDIHSFGAWLQQEEGRQLPESMIAHRWLERSFEPTVALVPEELRGRRDPAEIFHEVIAHWHRWSAEENADIDLFDAARRYVDEVLTGLPDERVTPVDVDADEDLEGYLPDPLADTGALNAAEILAVGDGGDRSRDDVSGQA
jgi:tRNA A-37 threonylcarbamoyl transferase component Bud32